MICTCTKGKGGRLLQQVGIIEDIKWPCGHMKHEKFIDMRSNIPNMRNSVLSGYPNTEKRVENTTRSGVFLTKFEVFG